MDHHLVLALIAVCTFAIAAAAYIIWEEQNSRIIVDRHEQDGWE